MKRRKWYLVGLGAAVLAAAGLTTAGLAVADSSSPKLTKVTVQLKWVTQSQFAGYYAAKAKGYYKAAGLDVNLKIGGPDDRERADGARPSRPSSGSTGSPACSPTATRATTS